MNFLLPFLSLAYIFNQTLDYNKNGFISVDDLQQFMSKRMDHDVGDGQSFAPFFLKFDFNGDGAVSLDEFRTVASQAWASYNALDQDAFSLQLRLQLAAQVDTAMTVVWVTFGHENEPLVRFGPVAGRTSLKLVKGNTTTYDVGLFGGWHGKIHEALMSPLQPGADYQYQVSANGGKQWSLTHAFTAPRKQKQEHQEPSVWAVLGDAGSYFPQGYQVLDGILQDVKTRKYSAVFHVGDLAYATSLVGDKQEIESLWDVWGQLIAPVAARIPYVCTVGNHENPYNFTSFRHRFVLPWAVGPSPAARQFYWSTLLDNVFWIQLDTQHYTDGPDPEQLDWIRRELTAVRRSGAAHWIIATGHRPQLNSDNDEWHQHNHKSPLFQVMEPLFREFSVDLYLSGHQHMAEFVAPVSVDGVPLSLPNRENTFVNPNGTVRVVQGTGGIFMFRDTYKQPQPAWSFMRDDKFGFGRVTVFNESLLSYEYIATEHNNKVIHKFYIQK